MGFISAFKNQKSMHQQRTERKASKYRLVEQQARQIQRGAITLDEVITHTS